MVKKSAVVSYITKSLDHFSLKRAPLQVYGISNCCNINFASHSNQPHFSHVAKDFLDEIFSQRWIGCRGPVEWRARSPDLTPPDFWLWSYVKNSVYGKKPDTIASLKLFIEEEIAWIPAEMIRHVTQSVVNRL